MLVSARSGLRVQQFGRLPVSWRQDCDGVQWGGERGRQGLLTSTEPCYQLTAKAAPPLGPHPARAGRAWATRVAAGSQEPRDAGIIVAILQTRKQRLREAKEQSQSS